MILGLPNDFFEKKLDKESRRHYFSCNIQILETASMAETPLDLDTDVQEFGELLSVMIRSFAAFERS